MTLFKNANWLRKHGQLVTATVTTITNITSDKVKVSLLQLPVSTSSLYEVIAHWTDPKTNTSLIFQGRCTNQQPHCQEGGTVPVFVDPDDPQHYLMELGCV